MTDIQEHLLELLKEIDQICNENGIEYYLDGGTALGAIRHRGFLPWDDDADIVFTRENWEKFEKYILDNPRPDRIIEDLHRNEDYTMVYARYCDTSKTCILRTSMIDQFKSGLFVDLFVLDPIPDTKESHKEYFDVLGGYAEYLNPFYYDVIVGANEWYDKFVEMGKTKGKAAVTKFVEDKLFTYPDEDGMTYGFRYDGGHFIYPRAVMGKPQRVPFENTTMPVCEKVEDYLRIHYGDNWYMIPDNADVELHNVVIDVEIPYEQFKNSYMGSIDRSAAIKTYKELHRLRVDHHRMTKELDCHSYKLAAALFARMLDKQQEKAEKKLEDYLTENNYVELRDILSNYFDMQLNKWYLKNRVFVPIDDKALYCALYLLLTEGKYYQADKIIALRMEYNPLESNEVRDIVELIESIRQLVKCFEQGDYETAFMVSSAEQQKHPYIPQFREAFVRSGAALAAASGDKAKMAGILEYIEMQDELFCGRDRVRAVTAFMRFLTGDEEARTEAVQMLESIGSESRDGLLKLEIEDFLKAKV